MAAVTGKPAPEKESGLPRRMQPYLAARQEAEWVEHDRPVAETDVLASLVGRDSRVACVGAFMGPKTDPTVAFLLGRVGSSRNLTVVDVKATDSTRKMEGRFGKATRYIEEEIAEPAGKFRALQSRKESGWRDG